MCHNITYIHILGTKETILQEHQVDKKEKLAKRDYNFPSRQPEEDDILESMQQDGGIDSYSE